MDNKYIADKLTEIVFSVNDYDHSAYAVRRFVEAMVVPRKKSTYQENQLRKYILDALELSDKLVRFERIEE